MVLSKRKRSGEFEPWTSLSHISMEQPSEHVMSTPIVPSAKEPRSNPRRSARNIIPGPSVPAPAPVPRRKPPAANKSRAPRVKRTSVVDAVTAAEPAPQAGPSQPTAPPAKRSRKKAGKEEEPLIGSQPEKRGALFKARCPQNILDRVERVMTQRIFMIDRTRTPGALCEEFSVLGSTGNVYTVTIDHRPRCNCPDACKGNHCKHILFILLKVLQVPRSSDYWYQKALLTSELETIFAEAPLAPNSVAHAHIREAHARAIGKPIDSTLMASTSKNKRIPGPDDDCPICYDGMHGVAEKLLVFCEECGNALHKECFQQWQKTAASNRKDLTCVWCRAQWVMAAPAGGAVGGVKRSMGGYINLSGVANVSPVRDTSTYYHGPRRGERFSGFQDYY